MELFYGSKITTVLFFHTYYDDIIDETKDYFKGLMYTGVGAGVYFT